jgi:hypothetical protein
MAVEPQTLSPNDLCDRCGARAVARTTHQEGRTLLWCKHHYEEHEDALGPLLTFYALWWEQEKESKEPVRA